MGGKRRVDRTCFNPAAEAGLPYELRLMDFEAAMQDLYGFFHDIDTSLTNRGLRRFERHASPRRDVWPDFRPPHVEPREPLPQPRREPLLQWSPGPDRLGPLSERQCPGRYGRRGDQVDAQEGGCGRYPWRERAVDVRVRLRSGYRDRAGARPSADGVHGSVSGARHGGRLQDEPAGATRHTHRDAAPGGVRKLRENWIYRAR